MVKRYSSVPFCSTIQLSFIIFILIGKDKTIIHPCSSFSKKRTHFALLLFFAFLFLLTCRTASLNDTQPKIYRRMDVNLSAAQMHLCDVTVGSLCRSDVRT